MAVLTVAALAAGLIATPAPASPDAPVSLADAEQAARDAAQRHLEASARLEATTAEREALEASIAQTEERLAELKVLAADRSADAYKRAGTTLSISLDVENLQDLDRRHALLARVAADDQRTVEELLRTQEELESQQSQLADRIERAESEAAALAETADEMNAMLADARAAAAAQAEQARAEAAQAAADAAPGTTSPPTGGGNQPAPPPPEPVYAPTPGAHPQHNHPWMVCTRARESGGNYQAHNPAGPFWGAYQFLQSTWNAAAVSYGRAELVGVRPDKASVYDQDDLAWRLFDNGNGAGHWGNRCMSGW